MSDRLALEVAEFCIFLKICVLAALAAVSFLAATFILLAGPMMCR